MAGTKYRRHYIPLESNPEVFTQLIHNLGVSKSHWFVDVLSIEDPDLLVLVPRPVLALIVVFPTSYVYEKQKNEEEESFADNAGSGDREQVMWFKQSVNNACGLYGVLHAVSNGDARAAILPDFVLAKLLDECLPLNPADRALALEQNEALELAHKAAALQGDSEVPASAEDEVDFHYVCFVKSHKNGHLLRNGRRSKTPDRQRFFGIR